MVGNGRVMTSLFQMIVVYLLLIILSFVSPKLRPMLYTSFFFLLLFIMFKETWIPFTITIYETFHLLPNPYLAKLLSSALLYFLSEIISNHLIELDYASIGNIAHFTVKISIVMIWLTEIEQTIVLLSTLITS